MAVEMAATAVAAVLTDETSLPVRPSAETVEAPIVPPTTPFEPFELRNTEKPVDAVRPATFASRSISDNTSWNSLFRTVRLAPDAEDADCVARVESRSRSVEMLLSAPSLIWSCDNPSLALSTPWFRIAWSDRYWLATAKPAASSPEELMRRPLDSRVIAWLRPLFVLTRLASALAAEIFVTTENEAIARIPP